MSEFESSLLLVSFLSNTKLFTEYIIGAPSAGRKTQCALLSKEFGAQQISLPELFYEKSNDQAYPHAKFLRDCLEHNVNVPTDLTTNLVEKKIQDETDERRWALLHGFPENMRQLNDFEQKVQKHNYVLLLDCSKEKSRQRAQIQGCLNHDNIEMRAKQFENWKTDLEARQTGAHGFIKSIDCNGSVEDVYGQVKRAFEGFVQHAKSSG